MVHVNVMTDEDYAGSATDGVCSQQISPQLSVLSDEVVSHDAQVNDWNIILDNFQSKLLNSIWTSDSREWTSVS